MDKETMLIAVLVFSLILFCGAYSSAVSDDHKEKKWEPLAEINNNIF